VTNADEPGMTAVPLNGRRRQAARNDERILAAAKEVFVDNPAAPIAAVADRAGVGISALYRRYPSKDELLGKLCAMGQEIYIAEAERALEDDGDPWQAYLEFLRRIVAANTHALSSRLAGTFTPTPAHLANAQRLAELGERLFRRTVAAGALRTDATFLDVGFMLELLAGMSLGTSERTAELRQRFLTVIIDGLHNGDTTPLPGMPPTEAEQEARWIPRDSENS
jgi:AcrR family transcriptional regulator